MIVIYKILILILILIFSITYLIYFERKIIGWMHIRLGPNRLGLWGLLQPISDVFKLIFKKINIPYNSNKLLFITAPIITIIPILISWLTIPINKDLIIFNLNSNLIFIMAITSLEVYGIILAGWSSNSKYALISSIRAAAQIISYEIPISFCLLIVSLISNSNNLINIVLNQNKKIFLGLNFISWNFVKLFPIFIIYIISGIAETNRHPFDVVECESELIAGHMIEYSGISFSIFFLSEYANIILISILTTLLFLGGWYPPIIILSFIPELFWLIFKTIFVIFIFIWIRGSLPRYRYDNIIKLGWKFFIPITLIYLLIISFKIKFL